jgi:hypothetical protein
MSLSQDLPRMIGMPTHIKIEEISPVSIGDRHPTSRKTIGQVEKELLVSLEAIGVLHIIERIQRYGEANAYFPYGKTIVWVEAVDNAYWVRLGVLNKLETRLVKTFNIITNSGYKDACAINSSLTWVFNQSL